MGLDLVSGAPSRQQRAPARRRRIKRAGPDQLLLPPRAARRRRRAGDRGPARPARERREPALSRSGVRAGRVDRGRQQPVAGAGRVPRGVRQGVRQPGALGRADRQARRSAEEPHRVAQVGGRARRADEEADDVPGVRRRHRAAGDLLPDDLPRAADDRLHPQHGAGDPAADAHPDRGVGLLRRLLVGGPRRAVRRRCSAASSPAKTNPAVALRAGPLQDHAAAASGRSCARSSCRASPRASP